MSAAPAAERDRAPEVPRSSAPWSAGAGAVCDLLGVDPERGLGFGEAERRIVRYGPNRLETKEGPGALAILAAQFRSVVVLLLAVAAALALLFGEIVEGSAILVVLLLNAGIGFTTELRAVGEMAALRELGEVEATVRREGAPRRLAASLVVPGDVIVLEAGDVVPADLRVLQSARLEADESALTGESLPIPKAPAPVDPRTPLAERSSMLYRGSPVTAGSGLGVAVATGMHTELGRVAGLVGPAENRSPLQLRLDRLGRRLVVLTVGIAALLVVIGVLERRPLFPLVETAIALAVAAIPEGLPIVATLALARGMWRMARRNALVERLDAVETLGSTTVILTDKTGTLTESRMRATTLAVDGKTIRLDEDRRLPPTSPNAEPRDPLDLLLRVAVLCSNASLPGPGEGEIRATDAGRGALGEPTEVALLELAARASLRREDALRRWPELREVPFDPVQRRMATLHRRPEDVFVAVKGAPEAVLDASDSVLSAGGPRRLDAELRRRWEEAERALGAEGLRVLAFACRRAEGPEEDPYSGLAFLGLVGMEDPPRGDVRAAIEACRAAGIRIVMVTGDQEATARHVATSVGLLPAGPAESGAAAPGGELLPGSALDGPALREPGDRDRCLAAGGFFRATPEHKLRLLELHQEAGDVVAMLGDGVNDAPALSRADIGVAMGVRGTQVARQAADIVLTDDRLATVAAAVEEGRTVFGNLRRFVVYLLSCNLGEILVVGLATVAGAPLPLLPLQLLFLNLVTDVFPALALGVGEGDPEAMRRGPRAPGEPFLLGRHWAAVGIYGAVLAATVLAGFALRLASPAHDLRDAVTVAFLVLAFGQLFHVFNMSSARSGLWRNEVTRNPWIWAALLFCGGLLLAAVEVPFFARVLGITSPGPEGWWLVLGLSLAPAALGGLWRGALVTSRRVRT